MKELLTILEKLVSFDTSNPFRDTGVLSFLNTYLSKYPVKIKIVKSSFLQEGTCTSFLNVSKQ